MPAKVVKFSLISALSRERALLSEQLDYTDPNATLRRTSLMHALAYVDALTAAARRGASTVDLRADGEGVEALAFDVLENEERLSLAGLGLARTAVCAAQHEGLYVVMDARQADVLNAVRAYA